MPNNVALIPVLEIESFGYSDRDAPDSGDQSVWESYFRLCYMDAGLDHLQPIEPGSMLFAIDQLQRPDDLHKIARKEAGDGGGLPDTADEFTQFVHGFHGGVALIDPSGAATLPGCCCSLQSLHEWCETCETQRTAWTVIWMGHDRDSVEAMFDPQRNRFDFRMGPWMQDRWDRTLHIDADDFQRMTDHLLSQLDSFTDRIPAATRSPKSS